MTRVVIVCIATNIHEFLSLLISKNNLIITQSQKVANISLIKYSDGFKSIIVVTKNAQNFDNVIHWSKDPTLGRLVLIFLYLCVGEKIYMYYMGEKYNIKNP